MKKNLLAIMVLASLVTTFAGCGNKKTKQTETAGKNAVQQVQNQRLLIIVDPQIDFTTGSLAVAKGPESMDRLAVAISNGAWKKYDMIIVTQDCHPANHCSFIEQGGVFPPHCVAGTEGMNVYPNLAVALDSIDGINVSYLTKGEKADKEEFSIFQSETNGPKLKEVITSIPFEGVDICGIASDYCVFETLKDLLSFYPAEKVRIVDNCIASVSDDQKLVDFMSENHVVTIQF